MAKTSKKSAGMVSSIATPAKKTAKVMKSNTPKKPYAKSHQEFIGNPTFASGKTAVAKVAYEKAKKGGAAKAAEKLTSKTEYRDKWAKTTGIYGMDKVKVKVRDTAKEKATTQRILTDKGKTAMRAKIIEMNAIKKANKKK